nr:MAG TPA: hypothetical protein [Caudoviricetes sp.]
MYSRVYSFKIKLSSIFSMCLAKAPISLQVLPVSLF